MLLVTDLIFFRCCFWTERMCHAALEIQLSDFTQNFIRRSVWINRNTKFENATLYLYLSWIAIIWDWTLEIPINKVSRSSHQLAKIGHVENGADICFYFSFLYLQMHIQFTCWRMNERKKKNGAYIFFYRVCTHTRKLRSEFMGEAFFVWYEWKKWRSNFLINVHKC